MPKELTQRQMLVRNAIADFQKRNGYAPSIRDLMRATRIKSPHGVRSHLIALQKKGWIYFEPYTARSVRLVKESV